MKTPFVVAEMVDFICELLRNLDGLMLDEATANIAEKFNTFSFVIEKWD